MKEEKRKIRGLFSFDFHETLVTALDYSRCENKLADVIIANLPKKKNDIFVYFKKDNSVLHIKDVDCTSFSAPNSRAFMGSETLCYSRDNFWLYLDFEKREIRLAGRKHPDMNVFAIINRREVPNVILLRHIKNNNNVETREYVSVLETTGCYADIMNEYTTDIILAQKEDGFYDIYIRGHLANNKFITLNKNDRTYKFVNNKGYVA